MISRMTRKWHDSLEDVERKMMQNVSIWDWNSSSPIQNPCVRRNGQKVDVSRTCASLLIVRQGWFSTLQWIIVSAWAWFFSRPIWFASQSHSQPASEIPACLASFFNVQPLLGEEIFISAYHQKTNPELSDPDGCMLVWSVSSGLTELIPLKTAHPIGAPWGILRPTAVEKTQGIWPWRIVQKWHFQPRVCLGFGQGKGINHQCSRPHFAAHRRGVPLCQSQSWATFRPGFQLPK